MASRIMFGLADSKVMAPPALDRRMGESVPAVRLAFVHDLASDSVQWILDAMAVQADGDLRQHTIRSNGRPLTAAAIGEGLIELGQLIKAGG
jgi:hypothetical protein